VFEDVVFVREGVVREGVVSLLEVYLYCVYLVPFFSFSSITRSLSGLELLA